MYSTPNIYTHIPTHTYCSKTFSTFHPIFTNCCNSPYCRLHDFNLCYCSLAAATYKNTSCTYSRTLINGWSTLYLVREWNTQPAYQQQANDRDQTNMAHFSLAVKKAILGMAISPLQKCPMATIAFIKIPLSPTKIPYKKCYWKNCETWPSLSLQKK